MSVQNIIDKIKSDAQAEAKQIIAVAEEKAAATVSLAQKRAEALQRETEESVSKQVQSILEKKEASDRLESAKILLAQKRNAISKVYQLALEELLALGKEDTLRVFSTLLERYAEDGDELYFAENFKYAQEVSILPIIEKRNIKIAKTRLPLDGGVRLVGKKSDKDLSYGALLQTDRENYQAQIAVQLFQ